MTDHRDIKALTFLEILKYKQLLQIFYSSEIQIVYGLTGIEFHPSPQNLRFALEVPKSKQ